MGLGRADFGLTGFVGFVATGPIRPFWFSPGEKGLGMFVVSNSAAAELRVLGQLFRNLCMYAYLCVCIYIYMYIYFYLYVYYLSTTYMYLCLFMMCVYIYIYIYIYVGFGTRVWG